MRISIIEFFCVAHLAVYKQSKVIDRMCRRHWTKYIYMVYSKQFQIDMWILGILTFWLHICQAHSVVLWHTPRAHWKSSLALWNATIWHRIPLPLIAHNRPRWAGEWVGELGGGGPAWWATTIFDMPTMLCGNILIKLTAFFFWLLVTSFGVH